MITWETCINSKTTTYTNTIFSSGLYPMDLYTFLWDSKGGKMERTKIKNGYKDATLKMLGHQSFS